MAITINRVVTPDYLSHYTTLEGLKGIIETGTLWASNAAYLNDKAELVHAVKASQKVLELVTANRGYEAWRADMERVFQELEDGGIPDTYVTCFCENDDNLSQWRGYGGATQGVSINFDRKKLIKHMNGEKAALARIHYTKRSTAKKMISQLDRELKDIAEIADLIGLSPEQSAQELRERIFKLLPRFKHLGFTDEKEWRFIIQRTVPTEALCFRVANNKLVPYIKIGIATKKLPIASIRVGPGPDQDLTAQSVTTFLKARGYVCPVRRSDIPFRA